MFNKVIYGIDRIIKCGTWQPVKFPLVYRYWNDMIFFIVSLNWCCQHEFRYTIKNHFIFDPVQKRETNWNFTGCQMPHFMIVLIIYIHQFIKPFLDKKISIFLRNMEPLKPTISNFQINAKHTHLLNLLYTPTKFLATSSYRWQQKEFQVSPIDFFCAILYKVDKVCEILFAFLYIKLFRERDLP